MEAFFFCILKRHGLELLTLDESKKGQPVGLKKKMNRQVIRNNSKDEPLFSIYFFGLSPSNQKLIWLQFLYFFGIRIGSTLLVSKFCSLLTQL